MLAALFVGGVGFYAFYAMQPFLLELWGDPSAYTVAGLAAAIVAGAQIVGGLTVPLMRGGSCVGGPVPCCCSVSSRCSPWPVGIVGVSQSAWASRPSCWPSACSSCGGWSVPSSDRSASPSSTASSSTARHGALDGLLHGLDALASSPSRSWARGGRIGHAASYLVSSSDQRAIAAVRLPGAPRASVGPGRRQSDARRQREGEWDVASEAARRVKRAHAVGCPSRCRSSSWPARCSRRRDGGNALPELRPSPRAQCR